MNIPHKFLVNNCISEQKLKFYEKLPNRYNKIISEYAKKKPNNEKFHNKVISWLFSQDEENRMILCSVENKKHTNTIYEAYNYYIDNSEDTKFKISDVDTSDSDKFKLDYNFNFSKIFDKNINKKKDPLNIHNKFLDYLLFYQCETPINDYDNYSSYFTFNPEFLHDEKKFKKECNELSNNKFLSNPIEIHRDPKIKNNLVFEFPKWIQDNKINQNYPYDTDEKNIPNYFTLAQYILALIEQVLAIRYIIYNDHKNLEEIISSTYLHVLFDKKKYILKYINTINIESKMYYKYFIEDINAKIFFLEDVLQNFIKDKKKSSKKSVNINENNYDFNNEENESAYRNIEHMIEKIMEKNKNDKNEFNKDLINMCMFIQIKTLFTMDDFFMRAIFEKFCNEYLNQICNDLIVNEEEKPKKKKKKKKKNNNINNEINNNINNNKEEIFNFIKKLILDNLEEKLNKINHNNINIINNKKEKNNKKQKEFFLYEPIKKKDKKKVINNLNNNNKINNINNNNEKNHHIIHEHMKNNEIDIDNAISTSSTNSNTISINILKYINISNDKLIKLNDDINSFNNDMENFLIVFRKIKNEIKNHFENIIKNIYDNNSELEIYGSSLYQLDIESSDLDLSILTKSNLSLEALFIYISNNNENMQYLNIKYIDTATIPVIKLKVNYLNLNNDKINEYYNSLINNNYYKICINNNIYNEFNIIKIDISLKSINYNQIHFIQNGINNYPQIKPLIKILKKVLIFKNMNNSYKGGMSSYCLFLIIYSYLKINKKIISESNNFGILLLGFLYYYINYIDFSYTIINPNLENPFIISTFPIEIIPTIIDPATMKNAGKIIFRIIDVINALNELYKDILLIIKEDKNYGNIIYKLLKKYTENK